MFGETGTSSVITLKKPARLECFTLPTTLTLPLLLLAGMMCVVFTRCLVDPTVPLTVDRANEHREEVTAVESPTGLLVIKSVQTMSSFSL